MPQLHETRYGRKLFERDIPDLIKSIDFLGKQLEEQNKMQGKYLEFLNKQTSVLEKQLNVSQQQLEAMKKPIEHRIINEER